MQEKKKGEKKRKKYVGKREVRKTCLIIIRINTTKGCYYSDDFSHMEKREPHI